MIVIDNVNEVIVLNDEKPDVTSDKSLPGKEVLFINYTLYFPITL